jgi:hypothetical protein
VVARVGVANAWIGFAPTENHALPHRLGTRDWSAGSPHIRVDVHHPSHCVLAIDPVTLLTLTDLWERAAIGPIPGDLIVVAGGLFHSGWAVLAFGTLRIEIRARRQQHSQTAMG